MIVVSDSSPLIAFLSVDRIDLLTKLFDTVLIPPAVYDEVFGVSRISEIPDFIRIENPISETSVRFLSMSLHPGESEAIALALEKHVNRIILDDKLARKTADRLGLSVIGTLGVLMLAKEKAFLTEIRPLIDRMIDKISFRIAPSVLNRVLIQMNEEPL